MAHAAPSARTSRLPTPAWLGEQRDSVRPLLEAFHHQTASYAEDGLRIFPTKMLTNSVDRDRGIAEELLNETGAT